MLHLSMAFEASLQVDGDAVGICKHFIAFSLEREREREMAAHTVMQSS